MQRQSALALVKVGVLATQTHVSDTEKHPVHLVYLLLYVTVQFVDEFGQTSSDQWQFVAFDAVRCGN